MRIACISPFLAEVREIDGTVLESYSDEIRVIEPS
jgi:hypothetical protein